MRFIDYCYYCRYYYLHLALLSIKFLLLDSSRIWMRPMRF